MDSDRWPEKPGFRWWAVWYLRASHRLAWGLAIATLMGESLLQERFPYLVSWRGPVTFVSILAWLWMLWALWPRSSDLAVRNSLGGEWPTLLTGICWGLMAWQREHLWALVGLSVPTAICFWVLAKIYERSAVIAIIGWLLAGIVVLFVPWPNAQRFDLLIVLGCLGTALQGGFDLVREVRALPRQMESITANRG